MIRRVEKVVFERWEPDTCFSCGGSGKRTEWALHREGPVVSCSTVAITRSVLSITGEACPECQGTGQTMEFVEEVNDSDLS